MTAAGAEAVEAAAPARVAPGAALAVGEEADVGGRGEFTFGSVSVPAQAGELEARTLVETEELVYSLHGVVSGVFC